jgi:uncharacterized lipoprotein YddW (UPF0748 family)
MGLALLGSSFPVIARSLNPLSKVRTEPVEVPPSTRSGPTELVEVRGLWVLRSSLATPLSISALVRTARASGFNTLFVQVRGRGEAYYSSALEPRASDLAGQPLSFDPLAHVIAAARAADMRVHAWVNVNLVASAADLPDDRAHVVYRHPDWLMVPRAIVQELRNVDGHSPAYAGKISRWSRAHSDRVEGLYLSPIVPEAAAYTEAVVSELAARYDLDGVHLDYLRYPDADFDYSRLAVAAFRTEIAPALPSPQRAALDRRSQIDPFAYPDALPAEWAQFRRAQLSSLAMRLKSAVKKGRPRAIVTAAVVPDVGHAFADRLQDWRTWLETGILDAICPMAYSTDAATFAQQIGEARAIAGARGVWAGIGAWRLSPEQTIEHISVARKTGAAGFVLFSYDSLTGPAQARPDYLDQVARAAFQLTTPAASGGAR